MRNPSLIIAAALLAAHPAFAINPPAKKTPPAPATAPAPAAEVPALTGAERYWLSTAEQKAYDSQWTAAKTPAEKAAVVKSMRTQGVLKNIPKADAEGYKKLIASDPKPAAVDGYLDGIFSITNPDDLKKLEAIKKGKGAGLHLDLANALEDYKAKMRSIQLGPDGRPKTAADRAAAIQKVESYRDMLHGGGQVRHKTPAGTGAHAGTRRGVTVALRPGERDWLLPEPLAAYDAAVKSGLSKAKVDAARAQIEKNLPEGSRADYHAAVEENTPAAIAAAIGKVPHYSGADIALSADEIKALSALPAPNVPAARPGEKASETYKHEIASVQMDAHGLPKGSEHLHAHEIVSRYRALIPKPAGAPASTTTAPGTPVPPAEVKPGAPGTASIGTEPLTPDQLEKLKDFRASYDKDMKAAGKDEKQIAAVNLKYRRILALSDKAAYEQLSDENKRGFCSEYKDAVVHGGGASVSTGACDPATLAQKATKCRPEAKTGKVDEACMKQVNAECGDAVPGATSQPPAENTGLKITNPSIKDACDQLLRNAKPSSSGPSDLHPTVTVASPTGKEDCGAKPKAGSDPSAKAGSDKDTSCKEKKPDPQFYRNVTTGMAFGMFGLILGSFFGGPLMMAAAAAVIGGGAFMLSKHLNAPKKE